MAVRSEGQFVGEMASFTTAAVRCATVRAKGNVRAKVIPGELLHDCVERIPEVGGFLQLSGFFLLVAVLAALVPVQSPAVQI